MERMGQVIGIKPDRIEEYRSAHADAWPELLEALNGANIRNYSIYLNEAENLLFSYWEYHGTDLARDLGHLLTKPRMQEWWDLCAPMQAALESRGEGEWWSRMDEIFHLD